MTANAIFVGWNRAVPGYEAKSSALFGEVLQYLGAQVQAGAIDSFEPVLLNAHGGDLNGFVLIRGDRAQLQGLRATDEWRTFMTRASVVLHGLGIVGGYTGDALNRQMELGMVHGTGAINAVFGGAIILEHGEGGA